MPVTVNELPLTLPFGLNVIVLGDTLVTVIPFDDPRLEEELDPPPQPAMGMSVQTSKIMINPIFM